MRLQPTLGCVARAQLRHSYNGGCERNDHSLFHYGFVQDLDPPRLAALDLPEGNLYDEAAFSEKDYGAPMQGCPVTDTSGGR